MRDWESSVAGAWEMGWLSVRADELRQFEQYRQLLRSQQRQHGSPPELFDRLAHGRLRTCARVLVSSPRPAHPPDRPHQRTFDHLPLRARRRARPRGTRAALLLRDERGRQHLGIAVLGIDLGRDPELRPAQTRSVRQTGLRGGRAHDLSLSSWYRKASSAEKSECVRLTLFRISDSIEGSELTSAIVECRPWGEWGSRGDQQHELGRPLASQFE